MQVKRSDIVLEADPKRVILNYLKLGVGPVSLRVQGMIKKVLALPESTVEELYDQIHQSFGPRHTQIDYWFQRHADKLKAGFPKDVVLSKKRELVFGAFLSKEYSIQSAALFNPSMVPHPDQDGLKEGEKRFIISLRSVGEGHISSIEFRSGVVNAVGNVRLDDISGYATATIKDLKKSYNKESVLKRTDPTFDEAILDVFSDRFSYLDYQEKEKEGVFSIFDKMTQEALFRVLDTNYDVKINPDTPLDERVVFPNAKGECMGMEDVRFVCFEGAEGKEYIGTYTAYDGHRISPQLIMTQDFAHFKVRSMYGRAVNDKGMALFPEKINDKYVMLGRQGGENISLMWSEDLYNWETYDTLLTPEEPWGLTQLGNCGSPIKTTKGWLVITHAVGPVREYTIGAILLDLEDPSKIIGKIREPVLRPNAREREGYVPNVVYSCGGMEQKGILVLPYAMSDSACSFASIPIDELLDQMEKQN